MLEMTAGRVATPDRDVPGPAPRADVRGRTKTRWSWPSCPPTPWCAPTRLDLLGELERKGLGARKVIVGSDVPAEPRRPPDRPRGGRRRAPRWPTPTSWCSTCWWASSWPSSAAFRRDLRPDMPSDDGVINRVVERFAIHRRRLTGGPRRSGGMKTVLVAGEINVDLILKGYALLSRARQGDPGRKSASSPWGAPPRSARWASPRLGTRSRSWARSATTPGAASASRPWPGAASTCPTCARKPRSGPASPWPSRRRATAPSSRSWARARPSPAPTLTDALLAALPAPARVVLLPAGAACGLRSATSSPSPPVSASPPPRSRLRPQRDLGCGPPPGPGRRSTSSSQRGWSCAA